MHFTVKEGDRGSKLFVLGHMISKWYCPDLKLGWPYHMSSFYYVGIEGEILL